MYCPDGGICWNVHNKNAFTPGIRELIALNMNPRLFPFVLLEQSLTFNNILSLFRFLDHFYCYAIRILITYKKHVMFHEKGSGERLQRTGHFRCPLRRKETACVLWFLNEKHSLRLASPFHFLVS